MGLPQLLSPSKLNEAQSCIQAGGDGVRDGVATILTAIAEYNDMQGAGGVNGAQVGGHAVVGAWWVYGTIWPAKRGC